jgi:hypothetical protein
MGWAVMEMALAALAVYLAVFLWRNVLVPFMQMRSLRKQVKSAQSTRPGCAHPPTLTLTP